MFKKQSLKKVISAVLLIAFALSLINPSIFPASTVHAASGGSPAVMEAVYKSSVPGSNNLLDPSRFTPIAGVNLKISSEADGHPGVDALKRGGSGYWRNSNSNVYMSDFSPSSLALSLDFGTPKTIDKLYLEIPNTIDNIQDNARRYEVYYSNDPKSWTSAPSVSGSVYSSVYNYDWKANGWTLAGGTETEGLWSYIIYNGQEWGYDTKTFLYPFTARYVMINTVLVGPSSSRTNDTTSMMGLSGLLVYGKDPVTNVTALQPDKGTYSTWDQVDPVSTTINLAGGQTLTGITKGGTALQAGDYSLSGKTVTFAAAYLAILPLGTNEFTFNFNTGAPSIFALDVIARGYGAKSKTIKMNPIEGVSPYNILGGAMGTDEPVEGVTKRIRDAYHAFYGSQPRATAADDKVKSVWDNTLGKYVFDVNEYGRGLNNEYLDKVRDGEYGHKGVFDPTVGYVVDGASTTDRQRVEIRPSEDSNGDFVAYAGDQVSYEWLWNIPDGDQWNQSNFRHIFQLKATNAQGANTLPGGNAAGENGAYILGISISGTTSRDLVVNHNRYDGDKTLLRVPLSEINGHWIKVELNALISDCGWLTIKITDTVTGKVYTFDSPDVYQVFTNQGGNDGVKDLWRRPDRTNFETEYPAVFDQYERPKWGIYRSSANGTNSAYDAELKLSNITISKVATGVSAVNLALNKKAYNVGPTEGANPIQMQSVAANVFGNANKLTNGVLQDPTKWNVTNVTSLDQIGNYSWLGADGARKGSFVIDLGQAMDFSQIRLFAKSTRLKGATVYVSNDFNNHTSAAEFNAMNFTQVDKRTAEGYTYATGNTSGGADSDDNSYPINLGKTYHSRYIKVTVENASGSNTGTDLTGAPRLTQVQVFNAPCPPQNLIVEDNGSAKTLKWDSNALSEGVTVYNDTVVLADLPKGTTSYALPVTMTDVSKVAVRSKGTDPYSRKFMISAPALLVDPQAQPDNKPKLTNLKVDGVAIPGFTPDGTSYKYTLNLSAATLPAITAEAAQGFTVKEILYPVNYKTDPATILVVSDSDANIKTTYTVSFVLPFGEPLTFPLQDRYTANEYTKNSAISLTSASGAGTGTDWPSSVKGYVQLNGNTAVNDYVAFTLKAIPAGTYAVRFGFKTNNNRATLQLSVDGKNQGDPIDEYLPSPQTYPIKDLGQITFTSAGDHEFKFTVTGKNAASSSQSCTFSFIQLVPPAGVEPIFVEALTLNKSSLTIIKDTSEQLAATVLPVNATNKTVTWSSSDNTIATVDQNGLVTGIGEGNATITATIGRFIKECTVTVTGMPAAATPAANPPAGTYTDSKSVVLSSATDGARIYYTTDGVTMPTRQSEVYTAPINVGSTMTIKAITVADGMKDSEVATFEYIVNIPKYVPAPIANIVSGTYEAAQSIELSCDEPGSSIYYTIDGSDPAQASSRRIYTGPIQVAADTVIKAIAEKEGMLPSSIAVYTYAIKVETPTANPPAGSYTDSKSVVLSSATSGAKIYYATDGSAPTAASTLYVNPIDVSGSMTIKAIAVLEGMTNSQIATFEYIINIPKHVPTPTANIGSGTYEASLSIELSCDEPRSSIYYTIDGSDPAQAGSRRLYTEPIQVAADTIIKAVAEKDGMLPSSIAVYTYTINRLQQVETPTSKRPEDSYTGPKSVILRSATDGARIYYTTDGSTPTRQSEVYKVPIHADSTMTIKAIAVKDGMKDSEVATFEYIINLPGSGPKPKDE